MHFKKIKYLIAIIAPTLFCINLAAVASATNELEVKAEYADLSTMQWMHGSESCKKDTNPALQVVEAAHASFVLRQNKCATFEAPFIYVLIGQHTALVVDTGAIESPAESPIYDTVQSLIAQHSDDVSADEKQILVVHSHSHGDHTKGDVQFFEKENVEVVGTSQTAMTRRLTLDDWPNKYATLDLGERIVTFIPIPGHQDQSIAIFDEQTGWLLSGDTFYPGSIRVKDWDIFKNSTGRLTEFASNNDVSMILGSHIEMNAKSKKIYAIGSTYQPHEPPLALAVDQLQLLNAKLQQTESSNKLTFESFIISPLSWMEKMFIKMMTRKEKADSEPN